MPKIEEADKETCTQIRKTRCNIATTDEEKVIGKSAGKWKGSSTIVEIFENNRDREKRRSKEKRVGIG